MDHRFVVQSPAGTFFTEVSEVRVENEIREGVVVKTIIHPEEFAFGSTTKAGASKFDTPADAQAFIDAHPKLKEMGCSIAMAEDLSPEVLQFLASQKTG